MAITRKRYIESFINSKEDILQETLIEVATVQFVASVAAEIRKLVGSSINHKLRKINAILHSKEISEALTNKHNYNLTSSQKICVGIVKTKSPLFCFACFSVINHTCIISQK